MKEIKHSQLPNGMGLEGLSPKDQFVYVVIHSFNNKKNECFPSLKKISDVTTYSIPTIMACVKRLKEKGYLTTKIIGRKTYYYFCEYVKYEPFSPEFINNDNISPLVKSFIIASQQTMFKDVEGIGKISYTNVELSKQIGMPEASIRKCYNELESKGYLEIIQSEKRDIETNIKSSTKAIAMANLGQAIIWTLGDHEDRLQKAESELALKNKQIEDLTRRLEAIEGKNIKNEYSF